MQRPWDRTKWRSGEGREASGLKQESIMASPCVSTTVAKGLSAVGKESPERCPPPEPVIVNLSGKRVFADVMK